jgi:diadenosine tetraphosphate (Ap4A) HIT family hydrolase
MYTCELCNAVEDAHSSNPHIYNTILTQTSNFVILPTIGPLVKGHCIIVSKQHFDSISLMNTESIDELGQIFESLSYMGNEKVLFTEHGSSYDQKGGACIIHAHVHILPGLGAHFNLLDEVLPIRQKGVSIRDLQSLSSVDYPYILNICSTGEFRLYEAYNVHSQMMRKAICNKVGNGIGDWKTDPKITLIQETIESWRS